MRLGRCVQAEILERIDVKVLTFRCERIRQFDKPRASDHISTYPSENPPDIDSYRSVPVLRSRGDCPGEKLALVARGRSLRRERRRRRENTACFARVVKMRWRKRTKERGRNTTRSDTFGRCFSVDEPLFLQRTAVDLGNAQRVRTCDDTRRLDNANDEKI